MGDRLRLVPRHLRKLLRNGGGDTCVLVLSHTLEQRQVGRFLNQGMLELVGHVRGERASIGKLRRFELAQGLGELLIVEWRDRQQKLVAECASQHCRQLGNLLHFRRRQPIQPGDQRIMKR